MCLLSRQNMHDYLSGEYNVERVANVDIGLEDRGELTTHAVGGGAQRQATWQLQGRIQPYRLS